MARFYKPDPNNPTLYNEQGIPVSYDQYRAQGGVGIMGGPASSWSDVVNSPVPKMSAPSGGQETTWDLSPWTANNGQWTQQPTLTVNGSQYRYNSPAEYISKLQELKGVPNITGPLDNFISQFQGVSSGWGSTPASTPAATTGKFYQPDPNNPQVYDAQGNPINYDTYKKMNGTGILGGPASSWSDVVVGAPPKSTVSNPPNGNIQAPAGYTINQATGGEKNAAASSLESIYGQSVPLPNEFINSIYNPTAGRDLAAEALSRVQSGAPFGLEQADVGAKKAAVELKAAQETQDFINKLASRGLYFSGKKSTGVSAIEGQKLADLLGIDRDYAMLLAKGIESSVKEIVKEAQKGSDSAISALDKLGWAINPISGSLEPTLAARNAVATAGGKQATAENQAAEFAMKYGITKPFYLIGTTVYRTSDRHAYSSQEEFFADTGLKDWPTAQQYIQTADAGAIGTKTTITSIGGRRVILTYDDKGNVINKTDLGSSTTNQGWKPTANTAIAIGKTNQDGSLGYDFFYVGTDGSMRPITEKEYNNTLKLKSTASSQTTLEEIANLLKQGQTTNAEE